MRYHYEFLTDEEINVTDNKTNDFHVVGGELRSPVLLGEISPPEHVDFFLELVKSALSGNMFRFTGCPIPERILRLIRNNADTDTSCFTEQSTFLANDFSLTTTQKCMGVFFFLSFTPSTMRNCLALIKWRDNEDVVRYVLDAERSSGS